MLFSISHFVLPPQNVTIVTQQADKFTPTQKASNPPLPLSLKLWQTEGILERGLVCVCVCVCVCSLSRQPISPQCWVLLQGVQYSQASRTEKELYSSAPSDSRQKCSTTSSSGFCGPFVSRHWPGTQNGSGGNPTPRPHVSHHPCSHRDENRGSCYHEETHKNIWIFISISYEANS